ncbi:MAG: YkvA family protein [Cyanobacteria bacterium P01_A01_bin.123]
MNPAQALYRWYRALIFNPRYRGWVILATVLYLVSPFDLSPDLLPVLGQIDDVALIMLLATSVYQWLIESTTNGGPNSVKPSTAETDSVSDETGPTIDVEAVSVETQD